MPLRIEQTQSSQIRQELKQILRIEQANLLEMPEGEFYRLIVETEKSPLFQRLYRKERLIHHQRLPRTNIASSFYQFKEESIADKSPLDAESLMLNKEHIMHQIRKLGVEKFKRYFLFPESGMSLEEIADECDLEVSEVQEINSLTDDFSILSEFYHPSTLNSEMVHYSRIASVERGDKGFIIGYFSVSCARGRYVIDYEKLEELKATGAFTETEARETKRLLGKLELINNRKATVNQILQNIVKQQAVYLESGNRKSLLPFSQKELAKRIGLAPSSVSRAISGKSIDTPWGTEVPLKHFFPRPRRFRKELLRQLLETERGLTSDEIIRTRLQEKFGVAVSRRSVASLRKELKIPAARREKALSLGE